MNIRKKLNISDDLFRVILIILGSIFSTLVLSFAVLAIIKVQKQELQSASVYMFLIFIVLGLSRLVTWVKDRTKISLFRFIVSFVFDLGLGILVFFGKNNPYFYSLVGGLFFLTLIISRVFKLIQNHSTRSVVYNSILIATFALFSIGLFLPVEGEYLYAPVIIVCVIVAITALLEVLSNAVSQLKFKTLFRIVFKTFAFEIILGLLTMIVASALVFMYFEDKIVTFGDGLWYSFAIVTTIGFGDFAATSVIGRITTVFLGIYGIIVVAVITSIIVNFYNETAGKSDSKKFKEIKKDK